jgi:hypothetical protein
MKARFHAICRRCGREIKLGQAIAMPKSGRAIHAGCCPDPEPRRITSEVQKKLDRFEQAGFR